MKNPKYLVPSSYLEFTNIMQNITETTQQLTELRNYCSCTTRSNFKSLTINLATTTERMVSGKKHSRMRKPVGKSLVRKDICIVTKYNISPLDTY